MHHNRTFFLKTIFFSFALFVESIVLSSLFFNFALSKNYFTVDWNFIIYVSVLLLLICYTYALTVGAWDSWLQFIIVPLPITLGTALIVARLNYTYAILTFFSVYLIASYDVYFATQLKEQLIKFNPKIILRFSTKGILLIYAVLAGILILISPISVDDINLVGFLADIADQQTKILLNTSLEQNQNLSILKNFGILNLDFKTLFSEQLDDLIQPYKEYIIPFIALLVGGSIQFLNSFIYIIFSVTIDFIFFFAKKFNILKVEYKEVMQEVLTY